MFFGKTVFSQCTQRSRPNGARLDDAQQKTGIRWPPPPAYFWPSPEASGMALGARASKMADRRSNLIINRVTAERCIFSCFSAVRLWPPGKRASLGFPEFKILQKLSENAKNSRFSASKWTMEAADTMREYRLSHPWPPEGRLWAQKGPKMAKNLSLKTGIS